MKYQTMLAVISFCSCLVYQLIVTWVYDNHVSILTVLSPITMVFNV